MFATFPCSRLLAFCQKRLLVTICTVFGCFLCGDATAAPGQLDPTFGVNGRVLTTVNSVDDYGYSVVTMTDGRILVAGACMGAVVNREHFCIVRYRADGSLDLTFNGSGKVDTSVLGGRAKGFQILLQSDGKILLAGACATDGISNYSFCLARYEANGLLDNSFNQTGIAIAPSNPFSQDEAPLSEETAFVRWTSAALLSDGRVVIAGNCGGAFCWVRFNPDGLLDKTLNGTGRMRMQGPPIGGVRSVVSYGAGLIAIVGTCANPQSSTPTFCVLRFTDNGQLDTSFNGTGIVQGVNVSEYLSMAAALQNDGKLVLAGSCGESASYLAFCIMRYNFDGTSDANFNGGIPKRTSIVDSDYPRNVAIQPDGKLVVVGYCSPGITGFDNCVARYHPNGELDLTFNMSGSLIQRTYGSDDVPESVALRSDGKLILAGFCRSLNADGYYRADICVTRLRGGPYNPLTCALNLDANATIDPATDALLLTRYLLGYRGDALTTGALGQSPTRTGQALETYIASLNLDADGDGQALAVTDGLLLLRAMLGLTGTALTQGATNASHPNVRNAQQILSWIESTHGVACLP